jgi:hypothetical protein
LSFGGALEDVQEAGAAEHMADLIFEREAVAAVDPLRAIGRRAGS